MTFHYQSQSRLTGEGGPGGTVWIGVACGHECLWSLIITLAEVGRPTRCEQTGDLNLCEHKHSHSLLLFLFMGSFPGAPSSEISHNDGQQSVTGVKNTLLCLVAFVRVFDQNNKNKAVTSLGHFQTCLANCPGHLYLGLDSLSFLCAASIRNTFYVG